METKVQLVLWRPQSGGWMGPSGLPCPKAPREDGAGHLPACSSLTPACTNETPLPNRLMSWHGMAVPSREGHVQRKPHESVQRQKLLGKAKLGQGSGGAQGSHTHSCPSKGKAAPEIHCRKSAGNIMAE